jgi:hypothetical protein
MCRLGLLRSLREGRCFGCLNLQTGPEFNDGQHGRGVMDDEICGVPLSTEVEGMKAGAEE